MCTCTHACVHAGPFVKSGDGILRENIPSCSGKNKGRSLPFSPLPLPLTFCLQAEGGILCVEEGVGTAESCGQCFGEKSAAAGLVLHCPLLCASLQLG